MKSILVVTLDDVSFYSLGFTGFFDDYTPNINKFAQDSYVFWNAHCNVPFCQPSRMTLLTGLYPQTNGSVEFNPIKSGVPTLSSILKKNGYTTGIFGKIYHHKPDPSFCWDLKFGNITEPGVERREACDFFKSINKSQPYFCLLNLRCTHRPFIKNGNQYAGRIPNFLPECRSIREDILSYLLSLKEADETFGKILSLAGEDGIIVLTSDHGSSFPYLKGSCYGCSTNVPLLIRSDNLSKNNDKNHVVSHVDFVPTILDVLGITSGCFEGNSYKNVLLGGVEEGFKYVYSQLNRMMHGPSCRTRAISDKQFTYVFNIDCRFPSEFVDGWGWEKSLRCMGKDYSVRNREEFIEYIELDKFDSSGLRKKDLKLELLKKFKDFKDPCCKELEILFKKDSLMYN